jgi:hypothetical protein
VTLDPLRMRFLPFLSAVLTVFLGGTDALTQVPVPPEFAQAHTVWVRNVNTPIDQLDHLAKQLQKWKRYEVVASPEEADLVFILEFVPSQNPYVGGRLVLRVHDIRREAPEVALWEDSRTCCGAFGPGSAKSIVEKMVGRLRERLDGQSG